MCAQVRFYYSFTSRENLYIVMEYLNGGDCYSLLRTLGSLSEEVARQYVAEAILALEYCHTQARGACWGVRGLGGQRGSEGGEERGVGARARTHTSTDPRTHTRARVHHMHPCRASSTATSSPTTS